MTQNESLGPKGQLLHQLAHGPKVWKVNTRKDKEGMAEF